MDKVKIDVSLNLSPDIFDHITSLQKHYNGDLYSDIVEFGIKVSRDLAKAMFKALKVNDNYDRCREEEHD